MRGSKYASDWAKTSKNASYFTLEIKEDDFKKLSKSQQEAYLNALGKNPGTTDDSGKYDNSYDEALGRFTLNWSTLTQFSSEDMTGAVLPYLT
jgi:hypothetical protein